MADLGDKIHKAILQEPTRVDFLSKKGKRVWTFTVGLLSVKEVIQISQIAYGIKVSEKQEINAVHEAVATQSGKVIEIISIMLKSRSKLPKPVIRWMVRKYSSTADLSQLIALAYESMNIKSFLNSIILLTGMSLIKPEEIKASELKTEQKKVQNQN